MCFGERNPQQQIVSWQKDPPLWAKELFFVWKLGRVKYGDYFLSLQIPGQAFSLAAFKAVESMSLKLKHLERAHFIFMSSTSPKRMDIINVNIFM